MPSRLPETAPVLPGYTVVRPIGTGGFADVFLYEQSLPRRSVAVKVLLAGVADTDRRRMFLAEATLMAQLAAHPDVLTVYEANIAADGRPYLVMEYCPESYGTRFRTERLGVTEVLQVALAVGSVLETAHRDGFLHRDVKPSNILRTSYGRPVLSDFGIAAALATDDDQTRGLSMPWSAPEVLRGTTGGTVLSEVYAFAATIHGLLAGRSPFEAVGGDNSMEAIQRRIVGRNAAPTTGRADVPARLEQALAGALSKDPARRPARIVDLLREFQLVEAELGARPSPLLLPTESVLDSSSLDLQADIPALSSRAAASRTPRRPRSASRRTDQGSDPADTGSRSRSRVGRALASRPPAAVTPVTAAPVSVPDRTVVRSADDDPALTGRSRVSLPVRVVAISVAALVVLAGIGISLELHARGGADVPRVGTVAADTTTTGFRFSWDDPGLAKGDAYRVRLDGGAGSRSTTQTGTSFELERSATTGARTCVTVTVVRDGRIGPASDPTCVGG